MTQMKTLLLLTCLYFFGFNSNAQYCVAMYDVYDGSATGEKYFVDFSQGVDEITLIVPGASPSTVTFLPGDTATVVFLNTGIQNIQYIATNTINGCADTINTTIFVCVVSPPIVTLGTNPGEFTVTDPAIDNVGENATFQFFVSGGLNATITGTNYINYPTNSTVLVSNSNGPNSFWYITNNGVGNCYDSVLVTVNITNVTSCQASLSVSPMTWVSPGSFYILDQSSNNSYGTFTCAGSVPSVVNFDTWVGNNYETITIPTNGVYPYTYITYDSISNCSDTITGVINVTGYPAPCSVQAGLNIVPGSSPGQYTFAGNSTGSVSTTSFYPGFGANSTVIPQGTSISVTYPANGTYTYTYIVFGTNGTCSDTLIGTLVVSNIPLPCGAQASLSLTQGATGGEFIITDQSTGGLSGTFISSNTSGNVTLSPGGSQIINYTSIGYHSYMYIVGDSAGTCYDTIIGSIYVMGINCGTFAALTNTPTGNLGEFVIADNSTSGTTSTFYSGIGWTGIPLLPNASITYTYPANGMYSYTYVVVDSITLCTDTLLGNLLVTGFPVPCMTQAGLSITAGSTNGEFTITDQSLNAATGTFLSTNTSGTVALSTGGSQLINYASNGWHSYMYVALDASGMCPDTLFGSIFVSNVNCGSFAGLTITAGANPGDFILTDNSTAGTSSYFYGGNGAGAVVLPAASSPFSYTANGTYNYVYVVEDSLAFCSDTLVGTLTVTGIIPPPNCNASFILLQDTLNASQYYCWNTAVNSTGGTSGLTYLWDFGDGSTSTLAYPTYVYGTLGTFDICLTITEAATGCVSVFCDTVLVTVKATGTTINVLPAGASVGIDEVAAFSEITLFPNPSDGNFTIQIEAIAQSTIELTLMNVFGQIVTTSNETISIGSNTVEINQPDLSNGLYLVVLRDQVTGSTEILRLIKE